MLITYVVFSCLLSYKYKTLFTFRVTTELTLKQTLVVHTPHHNLLTKKMVVY